MDEVLVTVFAATLNPDRVRRDEAEAYLNRLSLEVADFPLQLLRFATTAAASREHQHSQLAAAIRLRNSLHKADWHKAAAYQDPSLRAAVKTTLLQTLGLSHVEGHVQRQLAAALKCIVGYDYPQEWPELVPTLTQLLQSALTALQQQQQAGGDQVNQSLLSTAVVLRQSLEGLRSACKHYEDVTKSSEAVIDEFASAVIGPLVCSVLPVLHGLLRQLTAADGTTGRLAKEGTVAAELYGALRLTWKSIYSLTTNRWPLCLCDPSAASQLFDQLAVDLVEAHQELTAPALATTLLPSLASSSTTDSPFQTISGFRALKWTMRLLHQTVQQIGKTTRCEKRARPAVQLFSEQYCAKFASAAVALVEWHHQQDGAVLLSSKALIYSLELLEQLVDHEGSYRQVLQPVAARWMTSVLFARLSFSSDDQELWEVNPVEYVRRLTDPRGDLYSVKLVGMGLLVALSHAQKPFHDQSLLMNFAQFLVAEMQQSIGSGPLSSLDPESTAARRLDAALFAMCQLKRLLGQIQFGDANIEWLLTTLVGPLLSCSVGYLRAKAVYVFSLFTTSTMQWSSYEAYQQLLSAVMPLLQDAELPVQIQTCTSLSRLIRREEARPVVGPNIGSIMDHYFRIMRTMDHEGVVRTLRKTIRFYGESLCAWAAQLCQLLVDHFTHMHQTIRNKTEQKAASDSPQQQQQQEPDEEDDDETVDALLAADELVETLRTVVTSIPKSGGAGSSSPAAAGGVYVTIQGIIAPMLWEVMSNKRSMGFMEGCLHLLSTLIARSEQVAPASWQLVACLHAIGTDPSFTDYVEQLVPALDNFASVDPLGFVTAPTNAAQQTSAQLVFQITQCVMQSSSSSHHLAAAAKLTDVVLLNAWRVASTASLFGSNAPSTSNTFDVQPLATMFVQQSLQFLAQSSTKSLSLKMLFAGNLFAGLLAAPAAALGVLFAQPGAGEYVASALGQLITAVGEQLRRYDRTLVIAACCSILQYVLLPSSSSPSSDHATVFLTTLLSSSSPLLQEFVQKEKLIVTGELKYFEKKVAGGGGHKSDSDDDDDDSDDGDSTDDEDELGMHDDDEDSDAFDMDDEDEDVAVEGDGPIRSQAEFRKTLQAAQAYRKDDDDEDEEDDTNFLEEDDFESPLDEIPNVWKSFQETVVAVVASSSSSAAAVRFGQFVSSAEFQQQGPLLSELIGMVEARNGLKDRLTAAQ